MWRLRTSLAGPSYHDHCRFLSFQPSPSSPLSLYPSPSTAASGSQPRQSQVLVLFPPSPLLSLAPSNLRENTYENMIVDVVVNFFSYVFSRSHTQVMGCSGLLKFDFTRVSRPITRRTSFFTLIFDWRK